MNPQELSDADLVSMIQQHLAPAQPGMAEDVLKSIPTGLARGTIGLATAPFDLGAAAGRMAVNAAGHALDPDFAEGPALPSATQAANTALNKGTAGALGYDAKTVPGQIAQTISEFLPGAVNPAGKVATVGKALANMVRYGVIPGAASETAGQITKDTPAEPYARALTGMATGGAAAALEGPSSALQIIRTAAPKLSTEDAAAAASLMTRANQAGAPITVAEAIQHTTGGATKLGDVMRVVEGSQQGGAITAPFFAQRPVANADAASRTLSSIAPTNTQPTNIAPRVQGAARNVLDSVNASINKHEAPYYDAARGVAVPDSVTSDPVIASAIKQLRSNPLMNSRVSDLPDNSVGVLDEVGKDFGGQADTAATSGNRNLAAILRNAKQTVSGAAADASPDFALAKQHGATMRQTISEPLSRSPTGQLADAQTLPQQTSILFNKNPLANSETQVANAMGDITRREPGAANDITRNYLEQEFNEANQSNISGPNQFGGAKFAANVSGNAQQNKNLAAVMKALPSGDIKSASLQDLLDAFRAQGTRQRPGSQTAFNEELQSSIGGQGGAASKATELATQPMRLLHAFGDAFQRYRYGKNTSAMAKLLTEQDPQNILAIANQTDPSTLARILRSGVMPSLSRGFQ